MPVTIVAFAAPVYVACVFVLDCIPPPSRSDQATQAVRKPMPSHERNAFIK